MPWNMAHQIEWFNWNERIMASAEPSDMPAVAVFASVLMPLLPELGVFARPDDGEIRILGSLRKFVANSGT